MSRDACNVHGQYDCSVCGPQERIADALEKIAETLPEIVARLDRIEAPKPALEQLAEAWGSAALRLRCLEEARKEVKGS